MADFGSKRRECAFEKESSFEISKWLTDLFTQILSKQLACGHRFPPIATSRE